MALDRARTIELVNFVQTELAAARNPEKAEGMAWYMYGKRWQQTELYGVRAEAPFYGVQKPGRTKIMREVKRRFAPESHNEYIAMATALWELSHREEKYLAQGVAVTFGEFMVPDSLPLYIRFIAEGAWWDFVDETATHMIRELVLDFPDQTWPVVDRWIDADDMWLRRTALICQVGAKEQTDTKRLFDFCARRMAEKEFFIRKAIGWALREYAKTDAPAVADFARTHRENLSGLSFREATKHIGHLVNK